LRLQQRGLDAAVVDASQQVAALDELTFAKQHFGEDAADLRTQSHAVQRLHGADAGHVVLHVAALDLRHRDWYGLGAWRLSGLGSGGQYAPQHQAQDRQGREGDQGKASRGRKGCHHSRIPGAWVPQADGPMTKMSASQPEGESGAVGVMWHCRKAVPPY